MDNGLDLEKQEQKIKMEYHDEEQKSETDYDKISERLTKLEETLNNFSERFFKEGFKVENDKEDKFNKLKGDLM